MCWLAIVKTTIRFSVWMLFKTLEYDGCDTFYDYGDETNMSLCTMGYMFCEFVVK